MGKIPRIPVQLDRTRHLVMDLNAIDVAEELTGRNLLDMDQWRNLTGGTLKRVLYAALLRDDAETRPEGAEPLTLEDVGAIVHPGNLQDIMAGLLKATRASFPEPSEKDHDTEAPAEEETDEGNPPPGEIPPP